VFCHEYKSIFIGSGSFLIFLKPNPREKKSTAAETSGASTLNATYQSSSPSSRRNSRTSPIVSRPRIVSICEVSNILILACGISAAICRAYLIGATGSRWPAMSKVGCRICPASAETSVTKELSRNSACAGPLPEMNEESVNSCWLSWVDGPASIARTACTSQLERMRLG